VGGGFVFVPSRDFLAPRIRSHVLPESRTKVIINRTKVVNNIRVEKNVVVNRGPDPAIVERASGRKARAVPIEQVSRVAPAARVNRSQLAVYRQPAGNRGSPHEVAPANDRSRGRVTAPSERAKSNGPRKERPARTKPGSSHRPTGEDP